MIEFLARIDLEDLNTLEALRRSPITFGNYAPTPEFRSADHAAVFVDDTPIILTGWSEDPLSIRQSQELVHCRDFLLMLDRLGYRGTVHAGTVNGRTLFAEHMAAIVASEVGVTEMGGDQGPLIAVVLDKKKPDKLAAALCCSPAISNILRLPGVKALP